MALQGVRDFAQRFGGVRQPADAFELRQTKWALELLGYLEPDQRKRAVLTLLTPGAEAALIAACPESDVLAAAIAAVRTKKSPSAMLLPYGAAMVGPNA